MMHELKTNNAALNKEITEMNVMMGDMKSGWKKEESRQRAYAIEQELWATQR